MKEVKLCEKCARPLWENLCGYCRGREDGVCEGYKQGYEDGMKAEVLIEKK